MIKLFKEYAAEALIWAKVLALFVGLAAGLGAFFGIIVGLIRLGYHLGRGVFG